METRINEVVNNWKRIKNHCRTTVNKKFSENAPSDKFKIGLLVSEHSLIRLLEFDWTWENMKYWVSTEWSRHKFEKFISTQRTDRTGEDRNVKPQDALVAFDGYANAQNLIDAFRKRLCYQAATEVRAYAVDFKHTIYDIEPEMSDCLVPNCIYRFGCPGVSECSFFGKFLSYAIDKGYSIGDLVQIETRYKAYHEYMVDNGWK